VSMHKIELTELEREGLELHRLPTGKPSQLSDTFRAGVQFATRKSNETIVDLAKRNSALQAKIDALMLEFCPEEMTQEQIERWGENQVVSTHSTKDNIVTRDSLKEKIFNYYKTTDCNLGK
jgi:hypothetical protein